MIGVSGGSGAAARRSGVPASTIIFRDIAAGVNVCAGAMVERGAQRSRRSGGESAYRLVLHATYCFFVLQALVVATLIGTAITKSVAFSAPLDYVAHFTNWSWTLQIVFYALTLTAAAPVCVPFAACVVAWLFLPLVAIVANVVVLVWLVLSVDDSNFLTDFFAQIRPGFVMIGNDWFHLIPAGLLLLYAIAWSALVYYSLYRFFAAPLVRDHERCRFVAVAYQIWGFFALVAIYFAVLAALGTNVNEVYGTELNVGAGLGIAAAVALVVNGSVLFVLARCHGLCTRRSPRQEALLRHRVTSTAYEDYLAIEEAAAAGDAYQ